MQRTASPQIIKVHDCELFDGEANTSQTNPGHPMSIDRINSRSSRTPFRPMSP